MRIRGLILVLLLALAGARAQTTAGPFTVKDTTTKNCPTISAANGATVAVDVSGTFSLTLQPQVVIGSSANVRNTSVTPYGSTTAQSTITTAGGYHTTDVAGATTFVLCASGYVSGSAVVNLTVTPLSSRSGGGGGSGAVASVSNSDGTLTISPTTGAVVGSLNLNNANTWTALQTFGTNISIGGVTATGATGTGLSVFNNTPTLIAPLLGTPTSGVLTNETGYLWNNLANPGGNLSLTMGANTSAFNTTTAVAGLFNWANTTAALVGASQSSPSIYVSGTEWHAAASTSGGISLQFVPGTGLDAASTFNIAHVGSATGAVTSQFPGPIAAGAPVGGVGGSISSPEGTAVSGASASDMCYADSTAHAFKCSFNNDTAQALMRASSTSTTTTQVPHATAVAGVYAPSAIVTGDLPTSGIPNVVYNNAVNTATSAMTLDMHLATTAPSIQFPTAAGTTVLAGAATGNLTSPIQLVNTNSTNSNTSIGVLMGAAGTSTGGIGALIFDVSGTGDIARFYSGGSVSAGVYTVGTLEANLTAAGGLNLGGAAALTSGTSGYFAPTEGTAFTGTSTQYGIYNDSTLHCVDIIDQTNNLGCAVGEASIIAANVIPVASGTTSKIAASDMSESSSILSKTTTNTAFTVQGGADGNTTGAVGTLTLTGENVTAGSTASMAGGAVTVHGGDNGSSGATETSGAITVRGGDTTNASAAAQTTGAVTIRGGNNTSTGASTLGAITITGGTQSGAATNGTAGDVTIAGGLGTGTAVPAHVWIKSPSLGLASGSATETQVTRSVTHVKAGSTTSATATTMFNIASATNTAWGVEILVHVDLISSTPNVCGTTERISLTGTNNNGAFGTVNVTPATISTLCSAGTLTLVATATAANPSVISITPSWATITAITSATITITIENVSQQDITLL